MTIPKPAWAAEIPDDGWERACSQSHDEHVFWQLNHYAEHPHTTFDVTFYNREPILEVTLDKNWAREFLATLMYAGSRAQLKRLFHRVTFSNGWSGDFNSIWTIVYIPPDLDITDIDLAKGEEVAGLGGETIRPMISETYRCKSRAEEDFFLARWIAS